MEKVDTVMTTISENAEALASVVSEKVVDVVVAESVVVDKQVKKSLIVLVSLALKKIFQSCVRANAVQVAHPPTPPLKPQPAKEEPVVDELPPLEPSPEKV